MSRKFDFDKYKAIVDYIKHSSGAITTSIDKLVKGTIEMRANTSANIIKFSTEVKKIVIGKFSSEIRSERWISSGAVSIEDNGESKIMFSENYIIDNDSLIPPSFSERLIAKLSEFFVEKTIATIIIKRVYDNSVATFSAEDVPNAKFFRDNYVTKQNSEFGGKIILASDSIVNDAVAVNFMMAKRLAGVDNLKKTVSINPHTVSSNIVDIDSDHNISIVSEIENIILSSGMVIRTAPSEKSVVMSSNIESVGIKKDLSNLRTSSMTGSGQGSFGVMTTQDAVTSISNNNPITADIKIVPKTIQPTYSTDGLHSAIYADKTVAKDIEDIATITKELNEYGDGDIRPNYLSLYGISPEGFSPTSEQITGSRGRVATTIKHVYDMVAARLLIANKNIFIENIVSFMQSQISTILLKNDSSPEFARRPVIKSTGGDIGIFNDVRSVVASLSNDTVNTEVVGGW
jgi:hypothetical protein